MEGGISTTPCGEAAPVASPSVPSDIGRSASPGATNSTLALTKPWTPASGREGWASPSHRERSMRPGE
eukprot:scaffold24424_cov67-Isochrysis_galbana.AAC.2